MERKAHERVEAHRSCDALVGEASKKGVRGRGIAPVRARKCYFWLLLPDRVTKSNTFPQGDQSLISLQTQSGECTPRHEGGFRALIRVIGVDVQWEDPSSLFCS